MNNGDEFFFNHFICSSNDEDFVVTTMVVNEQIVGSVRGLGIDSGTCSSVEWYISNLNIFFIAKYYYVIICIYFYVILYYISELIYWFGV